jgi:hypothetical protein
MTRSSAPRRRGIVAAMIVLGIAATVGCVVAGGAAAGAQKAGVATVGCGASPTAATPTPPPDCTLAVTKVVTGKAASGTTFTVGIDCAAVTTDGVNASTDGGQTPPFTTTLTFGENGGAHDVLISQPASCTVTESPPPGCTLTSIDPKQPVPVETTEPVNVTVTNDCQVAPTPTTTVPAAQPAPAAAVVGTPLFTG